MDNEDIERSAKILAAVRMLTHLEFMRKNNRKALPDEILRANGCNNMGEFLRKLSWLAIEAEVPLPNWITEYL